MREIYTAARLALEPLPGYDELLRIAQKRPDVRQASSDFDVVHAQAEVTQLILRSAIVSEWELDDQEGCPKHPETGKPFVYHPKTGMTTHAWIEMVDDLGVKGKGRAKQ